MTEAAIARSQQALRRQMKVNIFLADSKRDSFALVTHIVSQCSVSCNGFPDVPWERYPEPNLDKVLDAETDDGLDIPSSELNLSIAGRD
jgi:hypothetical protein